MSEEDAEIRQGVLVIVGGVFIELFLGCFYLWGNIAVYVTSYFNEYDQNLKLNDTIIILPIMSFCLYLTLIPSTIL